MRADGLGLAVRLLAVAAACAASAAYAVMYKWVDEKGITHYGDKLPPEYVNSGSVELSNRGMPLKKTEPALTPEQEKARELELKKKRDVDRKLAEQRRRDQVLLDTYASEQEIDEVRNRNLSVVETVIKGAQYRINELTLRRNGILAEEAAIDQTKQQPLSATRQGELKAIDDELPVLKNLIDQKTREVEALKAKYDADAKRFREISAAQTTENKP